MVGITTEGTNASVDIVDGGRTVQITIKVNKEVIAQVLERWTWNEILIGMTSRDKNVTIAFPPIRERV